MPAHNHCFGFEADFVADLRCLPMAVRRKLDLAGVKLRLNQWHALTPAERQRLLEWADDPAALAELAGWLLARSAALPGGPAGRLEPARATGWQRNDQPPPELLASCRQLGLAWREERWQELTELQRFALVKLSHPGHEHRN
ncbi:MAG: nitrate reductase associated protein, partial [Synechococcaceae cyanobacterium]|nr:nitrate reductase associated protein [Synechococcaceae cyanobacterium]